MYLKILILLISLFLIIPAYSQKVFDGKFTLNSLGYKTEFITTRIYIGKKEINIQEPGYSKTYKIKKRKYSNGWMLYKVDNFWIKEMPNFIKLEYGRNNFIMYCLNRR